MRIRCCSVLIVGALAAAPVAAQAPDPTVGRILASPKLTQATAFIQSDQDRFVRELIALTEIPSPPFKEQARAKAFLEMLRRHGLTDVEMDAEGNVMGVRKGTGSAGMIEVNAHLDTVFPEGTDVKVKRTFKGPGGHSYGAFGLVNPAFAMGGAIAKFSRLQVPASPKTTFNIGVVSGGTSINSIPSEVRMDVDLRSESCGELKKVDEAFLALVREAVDDENRARSTKEGRIEADPRIIGERPCGETPMDAPLVQAVSAAIRGFGQTPAFTISSTDANIPMSMGIPAVTIGRGGPGGRSHSPDEWTDVDPKANVQNVRIALAILLAAAAGPGGQ